MAELRGLGAVNLALAKRNGKLLAISVDPPDINQKVVSRLGLPYPILADTDRKVTRAYGLLHPGGGPHGADIPLPANILVSRAGKILWSRVSVSVQDRNDPQTLIDLIDERGDR
jgi:peroxiredoxin